ncbi:immunoglobulin superfamily member 5 [Echeneis naucrates]|uniref:immunoglobulin superfamily member 5 n=1 Tax=Echeneis naucrates TaxID=173247 RepID=UPI0011140F8E|nr:immunoglobulin superfamily member 5-like [Echeneis naucrates]
MTMSWKSWPSLFHVCLLLCATPAFSQKFDLEPMNSTVLQGTDAHFKTTVHKPWDIMIWSVKDNLVLTFSKMNGIIPPPPEGFHAHLCPNTTDCVEFIIYNVHRNQSGPVTCAVQGDFGEVTAELHVQVNGTVSIMREYTTVEQDQQVEFHCVTTGWLPSPTVSWRRNGLVVNSNNYNTTSVEDGELFNSTSVLKFQAVSNTTVECQAKVSSLLHTQASSVFLVVVPRPPDWTVLIAVVTSFGGFALLVLLIIGIIFCCKRRKEKQTNYQDELRRVRTQSQLSVVTAQTDGKVNRGYLPDIQTGGTPSDHTNSGYLNNKKQNGNSNQAGNICNKAFNTLEDADLRKHRHATIV